MQKGKKISMKGKKNQSCKAQAWEILLSGMLETNAHVPALKIKHVLERKMQIHTK